MKRLFGIPLSLLAILALAACSEEKPPPKPKPKDPPVAQVQATVDGEVVGPNEHLPIGTRVIVRSDGSSGEGTLTYHWTLHAPERSEATFEFEGESRNAFVVDVGGTYTVELVVEDEVGQSEPATAQVRVAFEAPTAVLELIAKEPTVALEDEVTADGSASTDPSGQALSYIFRLTQRPIGSEAVIQADGARASFLPDRAGTYEVGLRVRNETTTSEEVRASIVVDPPRNRPPVAHAGNDSGGHRLGTKVTLNGSLSSDPDGDELSFAWDFVSRPEESEATIEDADQETAFFIPDVEGTYVVQLTVSDGEFEDTATVTLQARDTPNVPPKITAVRVDGVSINSESFRTAPFGSTVEIEIEVYDENPEAQITATWEVEGPEGSSADFEHVSETRKRFEADVDGIYRFLIVANDGELDSDPFSFRIRFRGDNLPPVAVIKTIDGLHAYPSGTEITLVGDDSYDTDDPPDPIELYKWQLIRQPPQTQVLHLETPQQAISYLLSRKGTYEFQLIVEDSMLGESEPDTIEVVAENRPPVARARPVDPTPLNRVHLDRLESPGTSDVVLDANVSGSPQWQSTDPDPEDETLLFQWEIVDQPEGSNPCLRYGLSCISSVPTSAAAFFTDTPGTYQVKLTVRDQDPTNPLADELFLEVVITEGN